MAQNGRPSMAKRQREMAKQEHQREKAAKRAQRAYAKAHPTPEAPAEGAAAEGAEPTAPAEASPG